MKKKISVDEAKNLLANRGADPGAMRPFVGNDGNCYIIIHKGGNRNDPKNYRKVLVDNATLQYDEWRQLDEAVVRVADNRLIGYDDLRAYGLVTPLVNPMGMTVLTWNESSDAMEANVSMDPVARTPGDRVLFGTKHIPIPVIHSDYQLGERQLQTSRNIGQGVDVVSAERAARKVSEKQEDMLFGDTSTLEWGGGIIYSYISHPQKNTVTLSENWDASSKTPEEIRADVLNMKQALINDRFYGPYVLYVPTAYETVLDEDYSVSGASMKTIRQRILDIAGIEKIQVVDRLSANKVIMVNMNRETVDLLDGFSMRNVEWSTEGGFVHNYKVMAIQVPRIRSEYNDRCGVCVLSA